MTRQPQWVSSVPHQLLSGHRVKETCVMFPRLGRKLEYCSRACLGLHLFLPHSHPTKLSFLQLNQIQKWAVMCLPVALAKSSWWHATRLALSWHNYHPSGVSGVPYVTFETQHSSHRIEPFVLLAGFICREYSVLGGRGIQYTCVNPFPSMEAGPKLPLGPHFYQGKGIPGV